MINIETLLSSFDERGTLLKWLKAVEKALNEATLTSVDVITISTQQIQLQFNFEDGTHLTTPTITLPKGDKGDTGATGQTGETGATGVGVQNVTVNASNHLIVTLTDETEIDAGEINVTSGVVIDTLMSASSENPVQNKVIYTALAGKQDVIDATHKLSADNVDDSATTNKFVTSAEKSTWNGKQDVIDATHKLSADNVDDSATTNKFVTSAEKSQITTNATNITNLQTGKQNALTTSSVNDGTIDKTIGFDSQGNIVKGSAGGGGGGSQLYKHVIESNEMSSHIEEIYIISKRQTAYNKVGQINGDNTIISIVNSGGFVPYRYNCMFCCDGLSLKVYYYNMSGSLVTMEFTTITDTVTAF